MNIVKIGKAVLYNGDCLEILPTLKRNSCEVGMYSPPYNLNKKYTNYEHTNTAKAMKDKFDSWYDDDMPEWLYQGFQKSVLKECVRVCRSSIFYNHKIRYAWHNRNSYRHSSNVHHPLHWIGDFQIWSEIIWDRCGIGNPSSRFHNQHELIYQIGKPKTWKNEEGLTSIWKIPPSRNINHVCTFPEKLVYNAISPTTLKGDIVIDPFAGVGTTGIVALRNGRGFIGIEKNKEYFEIMCKNIRKIQSIPDGFGSN